jgi:O-antigen ligase
MYPLLLCLGIYGAVELARLRPVNLRRFAFAPGAGFIGSVGVVIAAAIVGLLVLGHAYSYAISRFLNPIEATAEVGDVPRATALSYWFGRALAGPWFGSGLFSFEGSQSVAGAHNIYLTVWGETGMPLLIVYLFVLMAGFARCLNKAIGAADRLTIGLMWLVYLSEGFLWHNQFTSLLGILLIALLFQIPRVLAKDPLGNARGARVSAGELNAVNG